MATTPRAEGPGDASVKDLGGDTVKLVIAYAKQETLDPLKALARFTLWGVAGAVLVSVACVLLAVAVVRVLETELASHLSGSLTWVPYAGGLLFALLVAGLAVSRIGKVKR